MELPEPEQSNQDLETTRATARRFLEWFRRFGKWFLVSVGTYFSVCIVLLIVYNWTFPVTTGVQVQRQLESLVSGREYHKVYKPLPLSQLSVHLSNAVVAAEDTRFYSHAGFDWEAIQDAYEEGGRRGGSSISQQLAKNLFLTTHRSYIRKGLEVPLTFLTEVFLPKERILELYLNVVEWGDGVYGAEAAARRYFGKSASRLSRSEAAALASCLPNPRVRRPSLSGWYTRIILHRMDTLGY